MDRRDFLQCGSSMAVSWLSRLSWAGGGVRLLAADNASPSTIPDWTEKTFNATASASSYQLVPPWGYGPTNVFGDDMLTGWQADGQMAGAWLEIRFPEAHPVQELWVLGRPWPQHIIGDFPFFLTAYDRSSFYAPPRRIRVIFSDGSTVTAELRDSEAFQIIRFPSAHSTSSLRIAVEDVWLRPGVRETGIAKVRAFPRVHEAEFEIDAHAVYDVREGRSVQTATLRLINPGKEITGARLIVSQEGASLMQVPLAPILGRAVSLQHTWIPAPFDDSVMEFKIAAGSSSFGRSKSLQVPAYHSYFDGGSFAFNCTCHNDLGWLDTQEKTADYRSSAMILPALKLLKEYPEYRYSMESTAYLMEFLERHPERRQEITTYMKEGRFAWGASYVQCLETHVGPEKLVRQFYLGRRWLRQSFPGVDTRTYYKTDPPSLTLQMPQILAKVGVKYLIQGRMPFGYYNWQAPDGSTVFTYALPLVGLVDPKANEGWLYYAAAREAYYAPRKLPHDLMFDYWMDYLQPQADLPPYAREQNEAMKRFAEKWNGHFASVPERQIHPPKMTFAHAQEFLDEFTKSPLEIVTLSGDWPANWAYYDEPGNRTGLLAGRLAHNRLLTAERIYAGLSLSTGFRDYPLQTFAEAWQANLWPDHGWGGNKGLITDDVYVKSYEKSQQLADELLAGAGSKLASAVHTTSEDRSSLVVFNPLTWERADLVHAKFQIPAGWSAFALRDNAGENVPYEILEEGDRTTQSFVFVAEKVPSLGYRSYHLEAASAPPGSSSLAGDTVENDFFKVTFGLGGIKTLYDKRLKWDVLQTDKLDGGEVIQFTAPGYGWDDEEIITLQDFDKTSRHAFPIKAFTRTPIRSTAVREAVFEHFRLREKFHLYHSLDRLDVELELLDWDGPKERELRVAFPINLTEAHCTNEVPFGKVEMGKDELDFALLPPDPYKEFAKEAYGGEQPLPFREAINWIDVSDMNYLGHGCLAASDCTVHFFCDQTEHPAAYPVLQHVLLSTRQSHAWNPEYWCTQKGSYRFRMSLLPHHGDWRIRYRDGLGFNYPPVAFVRPEGPAQTEASAPRNGSFFQLQPSNLVLTALKKSEDDENLVIRFYEAEGFECDARLQFSKPISQAWATNLIEDEEKQLAPGGDGSVQFRVRPWEIVTLKVAF